MDRQSILAILICATVGALQLARPANGQTTWAYTECDDPATSVHVPNYAVESGITGDPVGGGAKVSEICPAGISAVNSRTDFEGAVTIDRINKVAIVTSGTLNGSDEYTFYVVPLDTANCSAGATARSFTSDGSNHPFTQGTENIVGISLSYHAPDGEGCEEPQWLYVATQDQFARIAMGDNVENDNSDSVSKEDWDPWFGVRDFPLGQDDDVIDVAYGLMYDDDDSDRDCDDVDVEYGPVLYTLYDDSATGALRVGFIKVPTGGDNSTSELFFVNSGFDEAYGVANDTSRPIDWESFCEGDPWWSSGMPLVYGKEDGEDPVIRRLPREFTAGLGGCASYEEWEPATDCGGASETEYVGALAYSAEIVSLGNPCGTACTGGLGTSTILADVKLPDSGEVCQINPGQSVTFADGTAPDFDVIACNGIPGNSTAYLLIQKNQASSTTVNNCTIRPDHNSLTTVSVKGTISGSTAIVPFNGTLPSSLNFPADAPLCPDSQHYYYCQWIFMCGGINVPLNIATGSWMASEPFRVAVSNIQ